MCESTVCVTEYGIHFKYVYIKWYLRDTFNSNAKEHFHVNTHSMWPLSWQIDENMECCRRICIHTLTHRTLNICECLVGYISFIFITYDEINVCDLFISHHNHNTGRIDERWHITTMKVDWFWIEEFQLSHSHTFNNYGKEKENSIHIWNANSVILGILEDLYLWAVEVEVDHQKNSSADPSKRFHGNFWARPQKYFLTWAMNLRRSTFSACERCLCVC